MQRGRSKGKDFLPEKLLKGPNLAGIRIEEVILRRIKDATEKKSLCGWGLNRKRFETAMKRLFVSSMTRLFLVACRLSVTRAEICTGVQDVRG
jgi:hypothetical protein